MADLAAAVLCGDEDGAGDTERLLLHLFQHLAQQHGGLHLPRTGGGWVIVCWSEGTVEVVESGSIPKARLA